MNRRICLETFNLDTNNNIIGVKIKDEQGNVKSIINDDRGNHIASAIDTLLQTNVPIGTTIKIDIELGVEPERAYTLIDGNLLKAEADVIVHQVNCMGVMGSGVAKAIRDMYPNVFDAYKMAINYYGKEHINPLGKIQSVDVNFNKPNTYHEVVNLFAQNQFGYDGKVYTSIDAFKDGLVEINKRYKDKVVAFPWLIGCVRGGANWDDILPLICNTLTDVKEIKFYRL